MQWLLRTIIIVAGPLCLLLVLLTSGLEERLGLTSLPTTTPPLPTATASPPPTATPVSAAPTARPLVSPSATPTPPPARHLARLEPASGCYVGVSLDWTKDSAGGFNQRLGRNAAVYVTFFSFPLNAEENRYLDLLVEQVRTQRGAIMLTLEPRDGLALVTPTVAETLAGQLATYNRRGVPFFVRFAHEMNGSWYRWGQQPTAYIASFRRLAEAIHRRAPLTAMVWAPNYGAGYPFRGGRYEIAPSDADFSRLDTNQDGRLDVTDDMYAPYYPGDDAVDWVGMSLYHWGNQHPWGENELPEAGKFQQQLHGQYTGQNGDERAVPDFYQQYVVERQKPMAITETAALFDPDRDDGPSVQAVKRSWWRQVFSEQTVQQLPGIKMINWFEWRKYEVETTSIIDWTITGDARLVVAFEEDLRHGYWLFAPQARFFSPLPGREPINPAPGPPLIDGGPGRSTVRPSG